MRSILIVFALSCCAFGQSENEMLKLVQRVTERLKEPDKVQQYEMPGFTWILVPSNEVNASADREKHTIMLNRGLVRAFYDAPGELAFVIAHEIGHIQDADCELRGAKAKLSGAALKRMCESNADNIGMQYLLAAGYDWWDAAGAMGRLLMSDPNQSSVAGIIFGRFTSDHPVDIDRIKQLAEYARQTCTSRPELCE